MPQITRNFRAASLLFHSRRFRWSSSTSATVIGTIMTFATPLPPHAVSREYRFSDGLSIRQLPGIKWERAAASGYLSQPQIEALRNVEFWLCGEWTHPPAIGIEVLRKAVIAAQIICPCGHDGLYLAFHEDPDGVLNNVMFER